MEQVLISCWFKADASWFVFILFLLLKPRCIWAKKNWFHSPRGEYFIDRPSHHQLKFFGGMKVGKLWFHVLWHVQFILTSFHDLTRPRPPKKVAEEAKSPYFRTSRLVKYSSLDRFIIVSGEIKEFSSFSICFEIWTWGTCTRPTGNFWKVHSRSWANQLIRHVSQYTILLVYVTPHF